MANMANKKTQLASLTIQRALLDCPFLQLQELLCESVEEDLFACAVCGLALIYMTAAKKK